MEKAIVMDAADNVATAIVELASHEVLSVPVRTERLEIEVVDPTRFGHKFAAKPIDEALTRPVWLPSRPLGTLPLAHRGPRRPCLAESCPDPRPPGV